MTRPAVLPGWARVLSTGGDGQPTIVEPSEAKKDSGWLYTEKPAYNYFNWLHNTNYNWLSYLTQQVDQFAVTENSPVGMSIKVLGGWIYIGNIYWQYTTQTISSIPAPTTNPRIDAIVLRGSDGTSLTVTRVAGTEAASPSTPTLQADDILLAHISMSVGMTEITNSLISIQKQTHGFVNKFSDTLYGSYTFEGNNGLLKFNNFNSVSLYENTGSQSTLNLYSNTTTNLLSLISRDNASPDQRTYIYSNMTIGFKSAIGKYYFYNTAGTGLYGGFAANGGFVVGGEPDTYSQGANTIDARGHIYYLETYKITSDNITGYQQNANMHVESECASIATSFDAATAIGTVWESVGPTGSDATNIWTALDSVPVTSKSIFVKVYNYVFENTTGVAQQVLYARKNGSSVAANNISALSFARIGTTGTSVDTQIVTTGFIPIDSNRVFELYRARIGDGGNCDMFLSTIND